MKRIVSFVMAAGMALSLAACGGAVSGASSTSTVAPAASSAAAADDGEILIGCLQDITGNTSAHAKEHMKAGEGSGHHSETRQKIIVYNTVNHKEEGHWDTKVVGGHWE